MDIASRNIEEVTTARWFVMRGYKNEKRAEEKLKGKDGLEYFIPKCYAVRVYHGVKLYRNRSNGVATEDILIDAGVRLLSE